ncbi:MAG: thermonuclease family protein [candidate division Zixibacteria bacterium]|nr:thermonuclease family protein [candidate division Zixibacteria bacterium]
MKSLTILLCIALSVSVSSQDTVQVKSIADGDTFTTTTGEKVRLLGIDAPENDPNSTAHLTRLIDGKDITLWYDKNRTDKYGRTLAFLHLPNGTDVCERMVADGYALVYLKYPCSRTDQYLIAETRARQQGLGIWAGHFNSTLLPQVARPLMEKAVSEFKSRVPSQIWPIGDNLQELYNGYVQSDTTLIINALQKLDENRGNQGGDENKLRLGILKILTGQYADGKKLLEPIIFGPKESTEGNNFGFGLYYVGVANDGLGNKKDAIENFKLLLSYWGKADIEIKEIRDARARLAKLTG